MNAVISMDELFYVSESPIHGKGLFAKEIIEAGTYLGTYEGPPASENDTYVLWAETEEGTWVGVDGKNILRYINHSESPVAEFEGFDLYSTEEIFVGQEITIDYGDEFLQEEESLD